MDQVEHVLRHPMTGLLSGKGRLWGSGNLKNWLHLDFQRRHKDYLFEFILKDTWNRPTVTPSNAEAFAQALRQAAGVTVKESNETLFC